MNDAMDHHARRKAHGEVSAEPSIVFHDHDRSEHRLNHLRMRVKHIRDRADLEIAEIEKKIAELTDPPDPVNAVIANKQ